ncbi:MAG: CBS domain-containing protein [Candidatus Roizmanbacteria bacterium]|nr:CBS domain-containing protein [Candidatus Roizmanbacteria bacterium]
MKVKDYMQQYPITISQDRTVREALRIFFNQQIHALLILHHKKLAGILAQEDILQNLFPSLREVMEDRFTLSKGEILLENLSDILDKPIKDYMQTGVITVTPNTSLIRAQSLMLVNSFSHIPVVNDDNELIGIIAQGDIFKALVSNQIPFDTDEEYHDWLAHHWDMVHRKQNRYSLEAASLRPLFDKNGVKAILDIGSGTGGHDVELAEGGYEVTGIDKSIRMHEYALKKYEKIPQNVQSLVTFKKVSDYGEYVKSSEKEYEAIMYMGNAFAHNTDSYKKDIKIVYERLRKDGLLILQIANAEKILKTSNGFQDFNIAASRQNPGKKYAFVEFYETDEELYKNNTAALNMIVLYHNGKRWTTTAVNSMIVATFTRESLTSLLEITGFSKLSIFGSSYGEELFTRPFDSSRDDWMNVVAVK